MPSLPPFDAPSRGRRLRKPPHDPVGHIRVPDLHHDFGRGHPESAGFWRWLFIHNGWIPVLGALGIGTFVFYVAWTSLDWWEAAAVPTFILMGVGLFWLVYVIVSLCRPHMRVRFRKFSMMYVAAPFALWGLGCLIYWIFNR